MYNIPISALARKCTNAIAYFDKINIRAARWLNSQEEQFLRANCSSFHRFRGNPFHHPGHRWSRRAYCIVAPNQRALQFLAGLPDAEFACNYIEPALDLISDKKTKWELLEVFDERFVQPRHRQDVKHFDNGGTITKQRGFRFVYYISRPSKVTGDDHCFHIEARMPGSAIVRRYGIERMRDLLTFDHAKFWQRHLDNFYDVDYQRLGIYHDNHRLGRRRRQPIIHQCGSFTYNVDLGRGATIWKRIWALNSIRKCKQYEKKHGKTYEEKYDPMTVQCLVDHYGRGGSFLRKIDVSALTCLIINMQQPTLYLQPFEQTTKNTSNTRNQDSGEQAL